MANPALWTPGATKPGATIPGLVISCAQCSQSVPPAEFITKEGLCIRCTVGRRCKEFRDELVRLYKKRERLLNVRATVKANDEQAARVRTRIVKYISSLTANQKLTEELVNDQGRLAREAALAGGKLHLPGFGGVGR